VEQIELRVAVLVYHHLDHDLEVKYPRHVREDLNLQATVWRRAGFRAAEYWSGFRP